MTPDQTSADLGFSLADLDTLRHSSAGPNYHGIGLGLIRYNTADVMRWYASRTVSLAQSVGSVTSIAGRPEPLAEPSNFGCVADYRPARRSTNNADCNVLIPPLVAGIKLALWTTTSSEAHGSTDRGGAPLDMMQSAAREIGPNLPIVASVTNVSVMTGSFERGSWKISRQIPLVG